MSRKIVITGLGVITPAECGSGVDKFWRNLCKGMNAIKPINSFATGGHICNVGGEVSCFESDRCLNMFIAACEQALDDSDILRSAKNIGISFGSILAGVDNKAESYFPYSIAETVARRWNLQGPNICVNTACASGSDAIGLAREEILGGRIDVMIAGAADLLSEFVFQGFSALNALTKDGTVRPFDKNRSGLALSEGAGVLVLEEKEHAQLRKAKIYAEISGFSSCNDAYHIVRPNPEGEGLSLAISRALRDSNVAPEDIDFISAHGTGTPYNDVMETRAIKKAFGKAAHQPKISSIKSMIGHTLGAASPIEIISCIKAMETAIIPPTINHQTADPECDLNYVFNSACKKEIGMCLALSAGFGGQNTAIVLKKG